MSSDGDGGGAISEWGDLGLPDWLSDLETYADDLVAFAKSPLRYLRARAIPPILGAIFGFTFDVADIIAQPFQTIIGSLTTLSASLSFALQSVTDPIADALALSADFLVSLTTPFGPLQPFALAALAIAIGYGVIVVSIRLGRAAADSIPVVSGIETFLFG
jgi:hypothetical protein